MAKINHQRPILKIIDNYRQLRRSAVIEGAVNCSPITRKRSKPMPQLSLPAEKAIFEMFEVFENYIDAEISLVQSLLPGKKKNLIFKRKKLDREKLRLEDVCTKVLVTLIELALKGDMSLKDWLVWFQKDAEKNSNMMIYDLLDIGFRPAFDRVESVFNSI